MSMLLHTSPYKFRGMAAVGTALFIFNILQFSVYSVLTAARFCIFPWAFARMLKHPVESLFLGTCPMGLATIINMMVYVAVPKYGEWARSLVWVLWWIDVVLTLLCTFGLPVIMFYFQQVDLSMISGTFLLPFVPAVVCAASGGLVASVLPTQHALDTLLVSYVLWGAGMSLSLGVLVVYFHRLVVHRLPNADVIISAFQPLGPCGQGAFGLIQTAEVGKTVFAKRMLAGEVDSGRIIFVVSTLIGLFLWGLGLWWLVHAVFASAIRLSLGGMKFSLVCWQIIFPLGVWISATIALGKALPSAFFDYLSTVLIAILVCLYLLVAGATIKGAFDRSLLVAPSMIGLSADTRNNIMGGVGIPPTVGLRGTVEMCV
jgi:C4-dicarboxylate transporter/malic acid transport protein